MKRRWFLLTSVATLLNAQQQKQKPPEPPEEEPPEEDAESKEKEYSFNPLQAAKEIRVGNYYFKKKNWRAASMRFSEATKWDPNNVEAWFRLGETQQHMKDIKSATASFEKVVSIDADPKLTEQAKKKLEHKN